MFPDLLTQMKHNPKDLPRNQTIIVKQMEDADGSFVIYHFMATFLRNSNGNVFVFSTKHSRSHYVSVLAKLGVQLNKYFDQNRCKFFDLTSEQTSNDFNLTKISEKITTDLGGFLNQDQSFLFVIDDLSVLIDLEDEFKKVFNFVQYFRNLTISKFNGVFLAETCFYTNFDCDNQQNCLASSLSYYADWLLTVKPLSTGWSKDVHGEVLIQEINKKDFHPVIVKLLYRLSDRNVTFTAPGLIPGVGI